MEIDEDLIAVAASRSGERPESGPKSTEFAHWIHDLPAAEKDSLLLRLMEGTEAHLGAEMLRRFRETTAPVRLKPRPGGRTVAELLAAAEERAEIRKRQEAERHAKEQARRQQERAAARAAYLDGLTGREEELWRQVENFIDSKKQKEYDRAVQLLVDLRDLTNRDGTPAVFDGRMRELRARHAKKPALLDRLDKARLPGH
jgi:hypothetical protein